METDKYNKHSDSYHTIKIALSEGYVEFSGNEWAKIEDIRRLCDCKELTPKGFQPIKK